MDASVVIEAVAGLLTALAAVGAVYFRFWREKMRRDGKKRPRK